MSESNNKQWITIGVGIAATAIAGYLLWRSRNPGHEETEEDLPI